jgi:O-antigen ligase
MSSAVVMARSIHRTDVKKHERSFLDSVVLLGGLSLLFFAPLAFGAVEPWSKFVLEIGSIALFALWTIHQAAARELKIVGNVIFAPMLAFGALIIFQIATKQTAYRAATTSAFLQFCSYGLFCFLLVQCLRRTWQLKAGAVALSAYGFALATFSLIQDITSNGKLYWIRSPRFGGWIYGPYVNHNHYAGLMEMLFPIPLVIFLSPRVQRPHKIMAVTASAVMASTIFLCGSRGGMFAFAVQIGLLTAIFLSRRERGRTAMAMGAFLVVAFVVLAWIGSGELVQRMTTIPIQTRTELSGGLRLSIDRDCLKMFAQKPITGWGLGVFAEVYPQFRSFYSNFAIEQAHNDYLQFLTEAGAVGFAIIVWFLFTVYRTAIRKLRVANADLNTEVALALLLGVTGILVHSFVDFNLQIPANALMFFMMCTAATMEPCFGVNRSTHRRAMAA